MDDATEPREPPDSPTRSRVLRFWDDQPPAALENQHEWDQFVDEVIRTPEEYRVEKQELSDATKLKEHGGDAHRSVAYEIVEWPTICYDEFIVGTGNRGRRAVHHDHHHVEQNVAGDELAPPALQNDEAIDNLFDDFPTPDKNVELEDIFGWNPFDDEASGDPEKDGFERKESDATNKHGGEIVEYQGGSGSTKGVEQDDADLFPFPELPPDCYSCAAIRIIIHCNETVTKRMEIHRRINSSFHVIICTETGGTPSVTHHEIVELQNFEMAEPFLVDYFRRREDDAHDLVFDSNDMNMIELTGSPPSTSIAPSQPSSKKGKGPLKGGWIPKSRITMQRERAAKMDLDDLKMYMHLPETEAAMRLGVCASVIKKVCRRNGLLRWPYRRIRAIDRSIAFTERSLEEANVDPHRKEDLLRELARLNNERQLACQGNSNINNNNGDDEISDKENDDN